MATPQPGIFALGTRYHHHLEVDVPAGVPLEHICAALDEVRGPHVSGGATNLVVGFGSALWQRIADPGAVPADAAPFTEIAGRGGHRAPATQHDLWAWVHGAGTDSVLDAARGVAAAFGQIGTIADECACFVYHDSRDLTGFVDGTANPTPAEAAAVACVPEGRPGAGGSHVITQRWVHDLAAFERLPLHEQERVFGRTKLDSVELPDRPPDAHISLAEVHDASGEERPIYRRSTPWGSVERHGLYFLGFSAERDRFDQMLRSMFGVDGAHADRLLGYSTAVGGSYYFAPSREELERLGVAT